MRGSLHPTRLPSAWERARWVEDDTDTRFAYLFRENMGLVGARERQLDAGPALFLDLFLELNQGCHNIRALYLHDEWKGALRNNGVIKTKRRRIEVINSPRRR